MNRVLLALLAAALIVPGRSAAAQSAPSLEAIQQRLDALEEQNAELRNELRLVREELQKVRATSDAPSDTSRLDTLEEKVDLQATRLGEHDLVKAESSQRVPVRLTGMVLFNAFSDSRNANPAREYPLYAAANAAATPNSGGTLRQSLFGLDFLTPVGVLGGQFRGSVLFDVFAVSTAGASDRAVATPLNSSPRVRTAWVEGRWGNRAVLAGLANAIISPREPNSLAQVSFPALSAAGNLYGWRPQIRFEQRVQVGQRREVVGQVAVTQTAEDWPLVQTAFTSPLETKRPGFETHVAFSEAFDTKRRFEVGLGYHRSETHVAGLSIPSRIYTVDWLAAPSSWLEITGSVFAGDNVGNSAGRNAYSFTILTPAGGTIRGIAVRTYGAWAQVGVQAAPRLRVHVYSGIEDPNDDEALGLDGAIRNIVGAVNTFFQVAPNVVTGFELSQTRTWWKAGQRPRMNHYDLYVAYVF